MKHSVVRTSWGRLLAAAVVLVLVCAGQSLAYTEGDPQFRAFYVDGWHTPGLLTASQVATLLGTPGTSNGGEIRAANCNAVVVEVRRDAKVCYDSGLNEPYFTSGSFDALQAILNAAHDTYGGKRRIEVHAWLTTFDSGSGSLHNAHDDSGDPANYWLTEKFNGTAQGDFDPGHPGALNYLSEVFMDVVTNYDIDGVNFDYIRFSADDNGYNPTSVARYNARYGLTGKPANVSGAHGAGDPSDQWDQWRRDQVSALVRQVYARVQAVKPQVLVSGDFVTWNPSPGSASRAAFQNTRPYYQVYSDWDSWMQEGIVDFAVAMNYYDDLDNHSDFVKWMNYQAGRKGSRHTIVAPGCYMNYLDDSISQLQDVRDAAGINGMAGYSYYAPYVTWKNPDPDGSDTFGSWSTFRPRFTSDVCTSVVDLPTRTWKTSPTKGHISGRVRIGSSTGPWADGATVSITGPSNRTQTCDGTGFYAFIDLPTGTYNMTVSYPGYTNKTRTVVVTIGAVTGNMYVNNFVFGGAPPVITNLQATPISASQELITWNTDVPATSQVRYGLTTSYGGLTPVDTNLVTSHAVTLTGGIIPNRLYHYYAISAASNEEGGESSQTEDHTFTTCGGVPTISNIQVTSISATSAIVTWTTNVVCNSAVNYGLTSAYGSTQSDPANVVNHAITLSGLTPYTTYHYQVFSDSGCGTDTSDDLTFSTLDQPVMTSVSDGIYTASTSQIIASWTATAASSPIVRYEYAVGSTSGGTQLRGWTDAGMTVPYTISGLSMTVGSTYYVSARAVNAGGLTSEPMSSAGVEVVEAATSVANAKAKPNGTLVGLPVRVVSAKWPDFFYVEDANRGSGIRVELATSLVPTKQVVVYGTMGVNSSGERAIMTPYIVPIEGDMGPAVQPVAVIGKYVGGTDLLVSGVVTPGVANMMGLNNVGLLVRMAGKVTKGVADGFYLGDGSVGVTDETGWTGVKVWTGTSGVSYENAWLWVTGVVSMRKPGATVPVILATDIHPY